MASVQLTKASNPSTTALTITAENGVNMSTAVFRMFRSAAGADSFMGVCTPTELSTLPADPPVGGGMWKSDAVLIFCATASDVDATWDAIKSAVRGLADELTLAQRLTVTEVVTLGS